MLNSGPVTDEQDPKNAIIVAPTALPEMPKPRNHARELVEAFLRGRNPNTLDAYKKDLEAFAAFLGVATPEEATRTLLSCLPGDANALALRYKTALIEKKLQPATVNRRLSSLRALAKLGRTLGIIGWSLEVENLRARPYRDTAGPGTDAVMAMLKSVRARTDAKGIRNAAIIRLLHDRGLRRGEVCSLDREHYDPKRGIQLRGKGYLDFEWLSLPAPVHAALQRWLGVRGDAAGPLFIALDRKNHGHRLTGSAIYAIVRHLGERMGVRARPHGLRHTAISTALKRSNGNVRAVQDFSRHRNVQTVLIYDDDRRDRGGEIATQVALDDDAAAGAAVEDDFVVACGRGHAHLEKHIGKLCCVGDCGAQREDKEPRRIQRRGTT